MSLLTFHDIPPYEVFMVKSRLSPVSRRHGISLATHFGLREQALHGIVRPMQVDETADRLAALGNATRLEIFRLLVKAGEPGLPVGAIQAELSIPASTLSHHVRHLVAVNLVEQERVRTSLICRANYDVMKSVLDFLTDECCTMDTTRQAS